MFDKSDTRLERLYPELVLIYKQLKKRRSIRLKRGAHYSKLIASEFILYTPPRAVYCRLSRYHTRSRRNRNLVLRDILVGDYYGGLLSSLMRMKRVELSRSWLEHIRRPEVRLNCLTGPNSEDHIAFHAALYLMPVTKNLGVAYTVLLG